MPHRVRRFPRLSRSAALLAVVLCALATLGFPGCPDDTSSDGAANPTSMNMTNLWPNADGQYWNYTDRIALLVPEKFEFLPPDATPPEITVEVARQLLDDPVTISGSPAQYGYELGFLGEITTQSGVTAQNLTESFLYPPGDVAVPVTPDVRARLLARVASARPDLRARLAARAGGPALPEGVAGSSQRMPYFIHGYAWRKTTSFIGTYGDVDTLLAWKFLDANIHIGTKFSHQLIPSIVDGIWLRALVEREVKVEVPGGEPARGLDVVYVIDYGIGQSTDAMGNISGTYRPFDYGRVTYVPGVGPVKDLERIQGIETATLTHGIEQIELDLTQTGIHPIRTPGLAAR